MVACLPWIWTVLVTNFFNAIKNIMNTSTIFLNRRQKVTKVDKGSDFFTFKHFLV
jgi:hypothetical protein